MGTPGTYTKVTTDSKGRVTNGTTLSASDIPDLSWTKITTDKPTTLDGYGITDAVNISEVGSANGVAQLGSDGKVPSSQLPSYVDEIVEVASYAVLSGMTSGATNTIYVTLDENKTYRWSGTQFTEISESLSLGITSSTAFAGDKGNTAYLHSQEQGNAHNLTKNDLEDILTGQTSINADMLDGYHANEFSLTGHTHPQYMSTIPIATTTTLGGVIVSSGLTIDPIGNLSLDLNSSTLVTPIITSNWKVYDNLNVYIADITASNSVQLENGYRYRIQSKYSNPTPTAGYSSPTSVSGSWGTSLPVVGTQSDNVLTSDIDGYSSSYIGTSGSYSVTFSKPKSGLIVVNNQVRYASGTDTTSASVSATFMGRNFYGYASSKTITENIIEGGTTALTSAKSKTISGVQTNYSGNNYFFFAYPSSYGDLSTLIVNGANSFNLAAGEAMTKSTITVTNGAGISVALNLYVTNDNNAFSTSSTLAFS